ncbi:hypothetical protein D6789_01975 [Candidatus Woesearchaeota archaeon]|nr:MAG: hypothetical protein D6789_01975 [Candidatus Woesearchaeota archaeon]
MTGTFTGILRRLGEDIADFVNRYPAQRAQPDPAAVTVMLEAVEADRERFKQDVRHEGTPIFEQRRRVYERLETKYGLALHYLMERAFLHGASEQIVAWNEERLQEFSELAVLHKELDDVLERDELQFPVPIYLRPIHLGFMYFSHLWPLLVQGKQMTAKTLRDRRDYFLNHGGLSRTGRTPTYTVKFPNLSDIGV